MELSYSNIVMIKTFAQMLSILVSTKVWLVFG